jgi:hypothetical protein
MDFTSDVVIFINDNGTIIYLDHDNWISSEAQDAVNTYYDYEHALQIKSVREVLGYLPETFTNSAETAGYLFVTLKDGRQDLFISQLNTDVVEVEFEKGGLILNDLIKKDLYRICVGHFPWWWSDDKECWDEE